MPSEISTVVQEPPLKRQRAEHVYPTQSRTISILNIANKQHPLNVKPSGNSLLSSTAELYQRRKDLLGKLSVLPNEIILFIISHVSDIGSLLSLSHTSRILYAFLYDDENWKRIYVSNIGQFEKKPWLGSWRNTILAIPQEHDAKLQLENNLLCCDELYRPYQCSQVDYVKIFSKILKEEEMYHRDSLLGQLGKLPKGRIARISEQSFGATGDDNDQFNTKYHDVPFILTDNDPNRWPQWTFTSLFERFPHVKFRQEAVSWDLQRYGQYLKQNRDENPLYLFDCNSDAMKQLRQEYTPPHIFQEDLFQLFQTAHFNCRPDHAWLIMGSARSGSTFHKDPNSTSAWNVAIQGRKLWIMLPPDVQPPGVSTDDEESEVTSPVGIAEWVISGFFNDAVKIDQVQIGVTFPGECMYVPAGWWHSVINIDDSIAITQNFVPRSKLPHVLNFFKNKPSQISGFRIKEIKQCLDVLIQSSNDESLVDYAAKLRQLADVIEDEARAGAEAGAGARVIDDDEDCGEIEKLPRLPIFEIFRQLLIAAGKEDLVGEAMSLVAKWELKEHQLETGKSKKWEDLTSVEKCTGSTFAFDFNESDSD
ncbi:uncharacterized protein LODBEIA_P15960 [Lodderomyces beijingensis]|uniref:JmjC domain-containing protein n=1 Tax=Lodderomyces beijingensis TaxID=1775926 RepID=A0ABP0ZIV3_9ASCO